eukprot:15460134-Alexandrium_andersonii.AAC.1
MSGTFSTKTCTSRSGLARRISQISGGKAMKLKEPRPVSPAEVSAFLPSPSVILENCWQGGPPAISRTHL